MGMARYVVDAVVLEGRSVRDVARAHGLSKTWIYEPAGHPALRQPPLPHRHRQSPQTQPVKLLIADRDIRVIDLNGQLIRELDTLPQPRLPAPHSHLSCPRSPETRVRDHPRLHNMRPEGIGPSACGLKDRCFWNPEESR